MQIRPNSGSLALAVRNGSYTTASITVPMVAIVISLTSPSTATLDGDGVQSLAVAASLTGDTLASGAGFTVSGGGRTMSAS